MPVDRDSEEKGKWRRLSIETLGKGGEKPVPILDEYSQNLGLICFNMELGQLINKSLSQSFSFHVPVFHDKKRNSLAVWLPFKDKFSFRKVFD